MQSADVCMRLATVVLTLLATSAAGISSQEPPSLQPGTRVRISTAADSTAPDWIVGDFVTFDPQWVELRVPGTGSQRQYPLTSIRTLEVSRADHSRWALGLALGFAGGAALGYAIGP